MDAFKKKTNSPGLTYYALNTFEWHVNKTNYN